MKLLLMVGLLGLLAVGCLEPQSTPLTIGVMTPLSGFLSVAGQETMQGIQLAQEDLNATDIIVLVEDEACDATKAVGAYQKLVHIDGVSFLIGPYCGQSASAVIDALNTDEVVSISPGAPDNSLAKPNDYFYRTQVKNALETQAAAEFLINQGLTRAVTYTAKNTFGESYRESFATAFTTLGGTIAASEGSLDLQTDFKTDIVKLRAMEPEVIFLVTASRNQMGIFVKQARELGYAGRIIGGSVTEENEFLQTAGTAAEDTLYVHYLDRQHLTPKQARILANYQARFGKIPSIRVFTAYDAFEILYDAIKACNQEVPCVRHRLDALRDFDGATGFLSFDENGDAQIELFVKTVSNGEFVRYPSE